MTYKMVEIGKVCHLINGKAFKPSDWSNTGLRIIRIQNLNDESKEFNLYSGTYDEKYFVKDGDLLFSWSGTPGTSFGAFFWSRGNALLNQHIFNVKLKSSDVFIKYLKYAMNSKLEHIISKSHGGVGLKHITKGKLEAIKIPLPPLDVQKKIVLVLDKAQEMINLRKKQIGLLDTLTQSVFYDMFGDPVRNEKGWEEEAFSECLISIESGWSPSCLSSPALTNKWGVLKLSAVTSGKYLENENKQLPDDIEPKVKNEVKPGDLLFTRKNTKELVGACAYVYKSREKLMIPDTIFRLLLNDKLNKVFIWILFSQSNFKDNIKKLASGSAASMPNISKSKLKEMKIPLPPITLQNEFAEKVKKIEAQKVLMEASLKEMQDVYASLMQRAFKGELFKSGE